jgi:hypothetical protein
MMILNLQVPSSENQQNAKESRVLDLVREISVRMGR